MAEKHVSDDAGDTSGKDAGGFPGSGNTGKTDMRPVDPPVLVPMGDWLNSKRITLIRSSRKRKSVRSWNSAAEMGISCLWPITRPTWVLIFPRRQSSSVGTVVSDTSKCFELYNPRVSNQATSGFMSRDLTISLDVIYHLVEDDLFAFT